MRRGFIQIPILIAIIIGLFVLGGTGYVAYEVGQRSSQKTADNSQLATTTVASEATTTVSANKEPENTGSKSQQPPQPATKPSIKQSGSAAPVQIQVQPSASVSAELLIEKCKAKRDISRGTLWPAMLEVIRLAEKENQQSRFNALAPSYQGTISVSDLMSLVKITDAEHDKNLQGGEAMLESQLAKEYTDCLNGN